MKMAVLHSLPEQPPVSAGTACQVGAGASASGAHGSPARGWPSATDPPGPSHEAPAPPPAPGARLPRVGVHAHAPSKPRSWAASMACRARPLSSSAASSSERLRLARFSSISLVQQV